MAVLYIGKPPQGDAQAGQKLVHGKWFCQIIVSAGIQRLYLIMIIVSSADDDDRDIGPGPHLADYLYAIQVGQA